MKRLLVILILTFSFHSLTKADDIRDFEIEGFSVGDSLLDYYSEAEINSKYKNYHYSSKKYYQIRIERNVNQYEVVTVHLKDKDKRYIIHNIGGVIEFKNRDKKKCENQMEIIKDSIVKNLKLRADFDEGNLSWDRTGKSKFKRYSFLMPSTNKYNLSVICQFWDVNTPFSHLLKTSINSEEFSFFLINEAYK